MVKMQTRMRERLNHTYYGVLPLILLKGGVLLDIAISVSRFMDCQHWNVIIHDLVLESNDL